MKAQRRRPGLQMCNKIEVLKGRHNCLLEYLWNRICRPFRLPYKFRPGPGALPTGCCSFGLSGQGKSISSEGFPAESRIVATARGQRPSLTPEGRFGL